MCHLSLQRLQPPFARFISESVLLVQAMLCYSVYYGAIISFASCSLYSNRSCSFVGVSRLHENFSNLCDVLRCKPLASCEVFID